MQWMASTLLFTACVFSTYTREHIVSVLFLGLAVLLVICFLLRVTINNYEWDGISPIIRLLIYAPSCWYLFTIMNWQAVSVFIFVIASFLIYPPKNRNAANVAIIKQPVK